jgi:hypothetical protein
LNTHTHLRQIALILLFTLACPPAEGGGGSAVVLLRRNAATPSDKTPNLARARANLAKAVELHQAQMFGGNARFFWNKVPFVKSIELCYFPQIQKAEVAVLSQHSRHLAELAQKSRQQLDNLDRDLKAEGLQTLSADSMNRVDINEGARAARRNLLLEVDSKLERHLEAAKSTDAEMERTQKALLEHFTEKSAGKIENPSRSNCRMFPQWSAQALSKTNKSTGLHFLLQT